MFLLRVRPLLPPLPLPTARPGAVFPSLPSPGPGSGGGARDGDMITRVSGGVSRLAELGFPSIVLRGKVRHDQDRDKLVVTAGPRA